jgi:hypothetical protein
VSGQNLDDFFAVWFGGDKLPADQYMRPGPLHPRQVRQAGAMVTRRRHNPDRCHDGAVLNWGTIAYGAALSAVLASVLVLLVSRQRRLAAVLGAAVAAVAGSVGWNAILRATHASEFFTDAPIAVFPASWQDVGSGVFTVATAAVLFGWVTHPRQLSRRTATMAVLAGLAAFVVDVYLY